MARKKLEEKVSEYLSFSLDDVVQFPIDLIRFHEDFQPRSKINSQLVDRYSENLHDQFLEDGKLSMPPVEILCVVSDDAIPIVDETADESDVWNEENITYFLIHGHHRVQACIAAAVPEIPAKLFQITWSEAVKVACQANVFNGFQLTRKELKVAIIRYLSQLDESDTESDRSIARRFGVSPKSIRNYRSELKISKLAKDWEIGKTQLIHRDYAEKTGYERAIGQGTYLGFENYRVNVSVAAAFCLKHCDAYPADIWSETSDPPLEEREWEFEAGQFCFAIQNERPMYGVVIALGDGKNSFDDYDAIAFDCYGCRVGSTERVHYLVGWFNFGLCLVPAIDLIPIAPFIEFLKFKYDYWQLEGEEIRQAVLQNLADLLEVTDESDFHYARLSRGSEWLRDHFIGGDSVKSEAEKRQIDLFDVDAVAKGEKPKAAEAIVASGDFGGEGEGEGEAKPEAEDRGCEVSGGDAIGIVSGNLAFWSDGVVEALYEMLADEVSRRRLG